MPGGVAVFGTAFITCSNENFVTVLWQVPVVVCANKVDLEHLREVTKEEGEEFAVKTGAVYIETRYGF